MAARPEAGAWRSHWRQLARGVLRVDTVEAERQLLDGLAQPTRPTVLAFVNAHAMNSAAASRAFFDALRSADVALRDGSGMAILLKLLKLSPGLNLNGTDLIPAIIRRYADRPIALFGTEERYLARARAVLGAKLAPGSPVISAHGFLPTRDYLQLAFTHRPSLIVLGMGMPRQEQVAGELRAALDDPCLIVCGGAIIDFLGGKTPRAPAWLRAIGMEWMYRLALEPRRLFGRYVIGNPLFIARAVLLAAGNARARPGPVR
jgi:N-acetylglucosaminyldiphosphoundecaprenol N-acetyl-beta-D-mannosaminyltransferase